MAKSRDEVLADLRNIFGGASNGKTKSSAAPAQTAVKAPATPIFGKFRKVEDEAVDNDDEDEVEEVEDEDTEESGDESETSPLDETLDEIQKMIAVVDLDLTRLNDSIDALRDHVAACR